MFAKKKIAKKKPKKENLPKKIYSLENIKFTKKQGQTSHCLDHIQMTYFNLSLKFSIWLEHNQHIDKNEIY